MADEDDSAPAGEGTEPATALETVRAPAKRFYGVYGVPWRCHRDLEEIDDQRDMIIFPLAWRQFSFLTAMDRDAAEAWLEDQCKCWRFRGFFRRVSYGTEETFGSRLSKLTKEEFKQLLLLKEEINDAAQHWLDEQALDKNSKEAEALAPAQPPIPMSSRGFHRKDAPLVQEMREHIVARRANGPWAASALVVDKAERSGSEDSARKRLCRVFSQTFSEFRTEKG